MILSNPPFESYLKSLRPGDITDYEVAEIVLAFKNGVFLRLNVIFD